MDVIKIKMPDPTDVVIGHEPGGGLAPQCQTTSSALNRSLLFMNVETGDEISHFVHPRFQDSTENCTWHNFNTVPTKSGEHGGVLQPADPDRLDRGRQTSPPRSRRPPRPAAAWRSRSRSRPAGRTRWRAT